MNASEQRLLMNFEWATSNGIIWLSVATAVCVLGCLVSSVCNAIVFLTIFIQKPLREKEYILPGFLSLLDSIYGVACFCMFGFHYGVHSTRLRCFFTVRNMAFVLASHIGNITLLMISIDRLLAIQWPLWYWKQTERYSYKMIAFVLAYWVVYNCVQLYPVIAEPYEIVPHCFYSKILFYYSADARLRFSYLLLSIVLYGGVLFSLKRYLLNKLARVAPETTREEAKAWAKYRKQLHDVTVTLGISSVITLFTNAIPRLSFDLWRLFYPQMQSLGWFLQAPTNWGIAANLFLYMKRHPDINEGVRALLKFKKYKGPKK